MHALFGKEYGEKLRLQLESVPVDEKELTIIEAISEALHDAGAIFILPFCFKDSHQKSFCLAGITHIRMIRMPVPQTDNLTLSKPLNTASGNVLSVPNEVVGFQTYKISPIYTTWMWN
jgi:hypothetical protein